MKEIFSIKGYNGEHITLNLIDVLGYPNTTSYDGGYDIICSLEIKCGCYTASCDRYFSASGALYRFQKKLIKCYETLEGNAKYTLLLENDLVFEVFMRSGGKAIIKGKYQEYPEKDNKLFFEIETDQTYLKPVIMGIDSLKAELKEDDVLTGMEIEKKERKKWKFMQK